jgi:hypothetical protein
VTTSDRFTLALLRQAADTACVTVIEAGSSASMLECEVRIRLPDAEISSYRVRISNQGGRLRVSESPLHRSLPVYCPQRHINSDSTFCLGFGRSAPTVPTTEAEARRWWDLVMGFLHLQNLASISRGWPPSNAWPHGRAAYLQEELEGARRRLNPRISRAISANQFEISAVGHLHRRRRKCPCGSRKQLRLCHERDIVTVLTAADRIHAAEAEFWSQARASGRQCCGTMDGCLLPTMVP